MDRDCFLELRYVDSFLLDIDISASFTSWRENSSTCAVCILASGRRTSFCDYTCFSHSVCMLSCYIGICNPVRNNILI